MITQQLWSGETSAYCSAGAKVEVWERAGQAASDSKDATYVRNKFFTGGVIFQQNQPFPLKTFDDAYLLL